MGLPYKMEDIKWIASPPDNNFKKIISEMKTTKTIFFAITVVLLSLLTTSCIPTTPGGNPTPGNQFDINISDENITSTRTTPGEILYQKKY
jgi:predicted small secreted protein